MSARCWCFHDQRAHIEGGCLDCRHPLDAKHRFRPIAELPMIPDMALRHHHASDNREAARGTPSGSGNRSRR